MTRRGWLLLGVGVVVVVAVAVAALAARGLTGDDEQPESVRVQSVRDIADQMGCSSFDEDLGPGPVAQIAGSGTCVLPDGRVTVSYFATTRDRDDWAGQMAQLADVPGLDVPTLIGENWAVQSETADGLQTLQDDLGGELVP